MPIPDAVAGPDMPYQAPDDPLNARARKVIDLANAALSGAITADEWEALVDSLDEKKG